MADEDVRVPAGWYPDPLGLPQLRWWDNHAWTEHTSDARQPMVAQETAATRLAYADDDVDDDAADLADGVDLAFNARRAGGADAADFADRALSLEAPAREDRTVDEPSPAHRMAAAGLAEDAPTSAPYLLDTRYDDLLGETAQPRTAASHLGDQATSFVPDPAPQPQYTGMYETRQSARRRGAHSAFADAPEQISTGPVWVIALMPVASLMLGLLFLLSGFAGPASTGFLILVLAAPYVATVALAYGDHRVLVDRGLESPARWAWALLTAPVYLAMRMRAAVRETGRGFGPLMTWATLAMVTLAANIAVPGLVISLFPTAFSDGVEQAVREDAAALGGELRVECPAVPPLLMQQSFECEAWNQRDQQFDVTVSLQRANGWIDWRVDDWGITSIATLGD